MDNMYGDWTKDIDTFAIWFFVFAMIFFLLLYRSWRYQSRFNLFLFKSFSNANNARMFFLLVSITMRYLPNKSRTPPIKTPVKYFSFYFHSALRVPLSFTFESKYFVFQFFSYVNQNNNISVLNFPSISPKIHWNWEKITIHSVSELGEVLKNPWNPLTHSSLQETLRCTYIQKTETSTFPINLFNLDKSIFHKLKKKNETEVVFA